MDNSGFFTNESQLQSVSVSGAPENLTVLYSSAAGCSLILRGTVNGKFRVFKTLKPEASGQVRYEQMLRKEFELGYSLSHPNICQTIAFRSLEPYGNCIEMEWVDGMTLDEFAASGPSSAELKRVVLQLCSALEYLHSRQLIHRDIKPSNILVTHNGHNVRLIDFSLSDSDSYSLLKQPAGTRHYAAPELTEPGKGTADLRCDIYSLGMVLKDLGICRRVAERCCRRDPSRRYPSVQSVVKDMHRSVRPYILAAVSALALLAALLLINKKPASEGDRIFDRATEMIQQKGVI